MLNCFRCILLSSAYYERCCLSEHRHLPLHLCAVRVFVADENLVFAPEQLMAAVLAHVHYMPDHWRGQAHTARVMHEFSQMFQLKAVSTPGNTATLWPGVTQNGTRCRDVVVGKCR